jgi:hypothetical protein
LSTLAASGAVLALICAPIALADPGNLACQPGQIVIDGQCNTPPPPSKAPAADGTAPAPGGDQTRH